MVRVKLWGSLRTFVDGAERVEVEVRDFRQLLDGLHAEYLALIQQIDSSALMALDWVIYRDAWFVPISSDSEVVLMPYMESG